MLSYGCYFESEKKVSCVQIKNFVTFLIAPIFFINAIKKLHIIKNDNGKFLVYICIICTILGKNWFQKMQTSFANSVSDIKIKM